MITNLIVAIASGLALFVLYAHWRATKLQEKSLYASTFNSLSQRINAIVDNEPGDECDPNQYNQAMVRWYIILYNAFEEFALFSNHSYLDPDMKLFYLRDFIEEYNRRIINDYPDVLKYFKDIIPGDTYEELRKACKNLPF